jgi:hypothetical protein
MSSKHRVKHTHTAAQPLHNCNNGVPCTVAPTAVLKPKHCDAVHHTEMFRFTRVGPPLDVAEVVTDGFPQVLATWGGKSRRANLRLSLSHNTSSRATLERITLSHMNSYTQLAFHGTCAECYRHAGIHNVDLCRRLFQQDRVSVALSRRPPLSAAQKCALIMVHAVRISLYFFTTCEG